MSRKRPRPASAEGTGGGFDRVPDEVVERAKAAYEKRTSGAVVATVSDAVGADGERHVSFEHGPVRVELRVTGAGNRWDVRGRVEPPQLRVELELEAAPVTISEEAAGGSFAFEGVPSGIMRLRLVPGEGTVALTTDWFRV